MNMIRKQTAKEIRRIRKILRANGYLKTVKRETERDRVYKDGRA